MPGAIDVGLEFHSLSKSYNMTGWRVGTAAGNREMIDALMVVKSNLDSGIPNAVQYMGIEALKSSESEIAERNSILNLAETESLLVLTVLVSRLTLQELVFTCGRGYPMDSHPQNSLS